MKKIINNIILLFITFILPTAARADMFMRTELTGMSVITPSSITAILFNLSANRNFKALGKRAGALYNQ